MSVSRSPLARHLLVGSLVSVLLVTLSNTQVQAQAVTADGWVPTQTIGGTGSPFTLFSPFKVAVDTRGHIIVADTYGNRIQVYNPAGNQLLATFPPPPEAPCEMYAHDNLGNTTPLLDAQGNPIVCTAGFSLPVGLAVGAAAQDANRIYVADQGNHRIVVLDSSAVDSSGKLKYVTSFGTYGSATIFGPNDTETPNPIPLADGQLNGPNDVAVWRDAGGTLHIYVVDQNNRIQDFRPGPNNRYSVGFKFGSGGDQPGAFEFPQGIGVDPSNGNLAVADTFNYRVQLFAYPFTGTANGLVFSVGAQDASGQPTVGDNPGEFNSPADVAFDANHRIWVAEWQNDQLQALDGKTGAPVVFIEASISPDGLGNPQGIWVDTDPTRSRVLVAETGSNRIQIFRHASLQVSLSSITARTSVGGQDISASVVVTNNGDVTLDDVVPRAVPEASTQPNGSSTPGLALATPVPVPSSAAVTLGPGASHPFTLNLTPQAPGTLNVSFDATGTHTLSGNTIVGAKSAPASVRISPATGGALGVYVLTSATSVQTGGTFQLTVVVSNTGDRPLNNVTPTVVAGGTASVLVPSPNPAFACVVAQSCQLPAGQVFTWTFTITAGGSAGQASLTVNATGTDSLNGTLIQAAACDIAGNCSTAALVINIKLVVGVVDLTAPEAYNQFDPQSKNNVVYQRDANLPLATVKPQRTPSFWWDRDDDGDDDGHDCDGRESEYRTYVISDPAGNTMRLVEKVHFDDKEVHVNVVGFVTTTGCPTHCEVKVGVVPPGTTKKFEWSTNKDGSFKELDQAMTIGRGSKRIHVEADYDSKKKQTTIKQTGKNAFSLTLPGQVLLRMATRNGALVIEFDVSPTSTTIISQ